LFIIKVLSDGLWEKITSATRGYSDILYLTEKVQEIVTESSLRNGLVDVFVIGSTASITTLEYEPALIQDLQDQLEALVSCRKSTRHSRTWGDDNGFSH
jgi:thiamine phosphate synthase YjbQ (UPF0047 family)